MQETAVGSCAVTCHDTSAVLNLSIILLELISSFSLLVFNYKFQESRSLVIRELCDETWYTIWSHYV
jgi:hypothetical protein